MTQYKNRKALIRARMAETGERYSEAARRLAEEAAATAAAVMFPGVPRTHLTPRLQGEPAYAFLNRSGDPHVAEIRDLMSAWLSRVPAEHVPDLRGRLQGKDKAQFESAFWELYLHEAYLRSGYAVSVHPSLAGTGRHPDFLVEGQGTRFYLEAVQACATADDTHQSKLLADVRRLLDEIAPGGYRLDMVTYTVGRQPPSLGKLRRELREWLSALGQGPGNPAAAAAYRAVSHLTWQTPDGWHVQFGAVPVLPGHTARHLVGTHTTGGWSDDASRITAAIESRADRYGALDAPLVIAVLSNSAYGTDDIDFEDALYGALIGRRPAAALPPPGGGCGAAAAWRAPQAGALALTRRLEARERPSGDRRHGPVPVDSRQGPAPLVEHAAARGAGAVAARLARPCAGHRARAAARSGGSDEQPVRVAQPVADRAAEPVVTPRLRCPVSGAGRAGARSCPPAWGGIRGTRRPVPLGLPLTGALATYAACPSGVGR
jgi:hypothetical protein